jgi:phosphatidylserine decarboxylase
LRWRDRAFVAFQYVLPQHLLSRLVRRATRARTVRWKNFLIRSFLRHFAVDMTEAVEPDPFAHPTFNAFFTRALKPSARNVDANPRAVVSPVDGTVSQAGSIDEHRVLQAKGHCFSLDALLAGDTSLASDFRGGEFATLYLAPYDYHRIHMPITGRLRDTVFVPGRLFSVNAVTARSVPELFARNERLVCTFDTEAGRMVIVLVGALFVGSLSTVWTGDIDIRERRRPTRIAVEPRVLERGAELGRFNMGSTVIVLLQRARARWRRDLQAGATVKMGRAIGEL